MRSYQVDDQRLRLDHLEGVLAKDAQAHPQVGLRIHDVVDRATEGQIWELAGRDEIELCPEEVATAGRVDQDAKERNLRGIECHPAGLDGALHPTVAEEDGQFILLDRQLGQLADVGVGPLEQNLALRGIGTGDELAPDLLTEDTHLNLQNWIRRPCRQPAL